METMPFYECQLAHKSDLLHMMVLHDSHLNIMVRMRTPQHSHGSVFIWNLTKWWSVGTFPRRDVPILPVDHPRKVSVRHLRLREVFPMPWPPSPISISHCPFAHYLLGDLDIMSKVINSSSIPSSAGELTVSWTIINAWTCAGRRYLWESVPLLPTINSEFLISFLYQVTDERNRTGLKTTSFSWSTTNKNCKPMTFCGYRRIFFLVRWVRLLAQI